MPNQKRKLSSPDSPHQTSKQQKVSQNQINKNDYPVEETVVIKSSNRAFLNIMALSFQYMILSFLGDKSKESFKFRRLKSCYMVHVPLARLRSKLLDATKLGPYDVTASLYDPNFKSKNSHQKINKKSQDSPNYIFKTIWRYIQTDVLSLKEQEQIIKQNNKIDVSLKEVQKPGFLIVRLDSQLKDVKELKMDHTLNYKLAEYKPNPKFCTVCAKLGHYAKTCKNQKQTCIKCSEQHDTKMCKSQIIKCNNCKGNHQANDKKCPQYIYQKTVLENMYAKFMTFEEAKQMATQNNKASTCLNSNAVKANKTVKCSDKQETPVNLINNKNAVNLIKDKTPVNIAEKTSVTINNIPDDTLSYADMLKTPPRLVIDESSPQEETHHKNNSPIKQTPKIPKQDKITRVENKTKNSIQFVKAILDLSQHGHKGKSIKKNQEKILEQLLGFLNGQLNLNLKASEFN